MAKTLQEALQKMNATPKMRKDVKNAGFESLAPFDGLSQTSIVDVMYRLPNWKLAHAARFAGIVKPVHNGKIQEQLNLTDFGKQLIKYWFGYESYQKQKQM
mmetsp:Transcript_54654/g.67068  ORF Transcript_54654/g.67068 Transcript_54654/m.67068 type:complete len:101 (-) Transcript_54654:376-678(-)